MHALDSSKLIFSCISQLNYNVSIVFVTKNPTRAKIGHWVATAIPSLKVSKLGTILLLKNITKTVTFASLRSVPFLEFWRAVMYILSLVSYYASPVCDCIDLGLLTCNYNTSSAPLCRYNMQVLALTSTVTLNCEFECS